MILTHARVATQTTPGSSLKSGQRIAVGGYEVCKAVYIVKMKTTFHSYGN